MSIKVSGFISRLGYSDKFGAFTQTHYTYGKNIASFNPDVNTYHDFEIVSLNRVDGNDNHSYDVVSSQDMTDIANIVNWLFDSAANLLTSNVEETNARLHEKFVTSVVTAVIADEMVVDRHNNILPNRIQVDIERDGTVNTYTYWINASKFTDEYDGHDSTIFLPTPTVDQLVTDKATLEDYIQRITIDDYNDRLNSTGMASPYTAVRSLETTWVNKDDSTESMLIRFTFACYGPISDDVGVLKQELRKHILRNSEILEAVWERILPEIFTATTFIMIPAWDYTSGGLATAEYFNPIISTKDGMQFFKNHLTNFTDAHLLEHFESLPVIWQSIGIWICANPNNPVGSRSLRQNLEDYILVEPKETGDFIRLSTQTKDFILKINNYLPIIAKYKPTDTPADLVLEVIDGLNFLVFTSFNVKCKILCKLDYLAIINKDSGVA